MDLIQLLISVVIIGLLLAIGVLMILSKTEDARQNSADASVVQGVTAVMAIQAQAGQPNEWAANIETEASRMSTSKHVTVSEASVNPLTSPIIVQYTLSGYQRYAEITPAGGLSYSSGVAP